MKNIVLEERSITPSKIVCIGRNYAAHIEELNNTVPEQAVIFIKPNSAIADEILIQGDDEIHFEGEISFVIEDNKIAAVGFGLDLTKRQVQFDLKSKGLPWERAKAFNASAVFSEFKPFNGNTDGLSLELYINDQLIQQGGCSLMLFKPDVILDDVTGFLTLEDGDLIMTGTPAGVGQVHSGDKFLGKIFDNGQLIVEKSWLVK